MPTYQELASALCEPFPSDALGLKPGALNHDHSRALVLAYADTRTYQERLDQVVGPDSWSVRFNLLPTGAICALTILGITKADVGDYPADYPEKPHENRSTAAAAQAFKRACAQFGIGRYLYALPRTWADYDSEARQFICPAAIIASLYYAVGLADFVTPDTKRAILIGQSHTTNGEVPTSANNAPHANAEKIAHARAVLTQAEQRTAINLHSNTASEAQLGLIARLISEMLRASDPEEATAAAEAIDAIGDQHTVTKLATYRSKDQLRTLNLNKAVASTLITELKQLQEYAVSAV